MSIFLRDTTEIIYSTIIDTPSGGITKGDFVQVGSGSVYGFAFSTATLDPTDRDNYAEQVTIVTKARQVRITKDTGTGEPEFAQGETVYIDPATDKAEKSGGSNIKVGFALTAATTADDGVTSDFDGRLGL
jgi:predicted RecA/RadA family phage recombinase